MGLLTKLLTLPVSGPIDGLMWLANTIEEQAATVHYNEPALRNRLVELELQFEMGQITEDEYAAAEEALLTQMREARAWRIARGQR
jgi:Gas vesicle protein G